jgi:phage antirepressor YoqD-like protein
MVENNEQGRLVRKYFISVEKKAKEIFAIPKTMSEALRLAANLAEQNEKLVAENEVMAPKADYHDNVLNSNKLIRTKDIAKHLGFRSDRALYKKLSELKVLYKSGNTYIQYADYNFLITEGYADYTVNEYGQTFKWTEKGRKWLIQLIRKQGIISRKLLIEAVTAVQA